VTRPQYFTACFAAAFSVALIVVCLRDAPSLLAVSALGILSALSLVLMTLDLSRIVEISLSVSKGELSVKASPENVDETLKAVADQEAIGQKDGGQSAETLRPLVASVEHKDNSARTDADYLTLATDAWRAKKFDDAMRYVYVGLERPASDTRITAALYSRLGTVEHDLGLYEKAIKHCQDSIDIDPNFAPAFSNLGNPLTIMERFEEAETAYREAIRLDPDLTMAHNNLGFLQFNSGQFEEAETSYREAIRLDPNYIKAHRNLGILLKKMGETKESEEMLARAKELKQAQK